MPLREGRPSPFCNPGNRELFQFTPLREGRPATVIGGITAQLAFQFTPLREGRPTSTPCRTRRRNFNSRPSARGDRRRRACGWNCEFQFTPLREGRLRRRHPQKRLADFNSRPSARGDVHGVCWGYWNLISIHAPPRGATTLQPATPPRCVFQFTPLREGRHVPDQPAEPVPHFNSRPSARGDPILSALFIPETISIHAPPRGATLAGGREKRRFIISIHAPPRGATVYGYNDVQNPSISIHAPPRGATWNVSASAIMLVFQFTPLREGRRADVGDEHFLAISIHAPPRGATRPFVGAFLLRNHFNSRPSARGDTSPSPIR